jgi:propanol-preferring alcohol dehydrogenase
MDGLNLMERIMEQKLYRAVQVTAPGVLEIVMRPIAEPAPGFVRLRVEACGVCHSDAATVDAVFPITFPRVPGHEVIGVIDAVGQGVAGWRIGQRVGVGFLGGACGWCEMCLSGDPVNCRNQEITGVHIDGGYAESMHARAAALVSIPDEFEPAEAAPLLCAGLTTFNALRKSPARAGDRVAVLGIGGLGHLALQFARKMGFETIAIGRGADKEDLARSLGAHHYIDSDVADVAEALQALGGMHVILATAPGAKAISACMKGLRERGRLVVVAAALEPIEIAATDLIFGGRGIDGSLTGDVATTDAALSFSRQAGVRAVIETLPLEDAPEAYARMMAGQARFRVVLTINP